MSVDVCTEVVIDAPVDRVAGFAGDPSNAPQWYVNIESVEWERSTRMTLRNRGNPSGFSKVGAPLMVSSMRRANRNDLAALKKLLEAESAPTT